MNSLRELNNYAKELMTFDDQRPANVIFDRAEAEDLAFTELVRIFTVKNTINIEEIIQPQICDVRYQINLGDLAGVLSWPNLPPEVSVEFTNFGTIYTVSGITTAEIWDLVKNPLINLPEDYNGAFSYTAKILYNTDTQSDLEISWSVGVYAPLSLMAAKATASASIKRTRRIGVDILSSFGIGFGTIIKGRLEAGAADLAGIFATSATFLKGKLVNVTPVLTSTISISMNSTRVRRASSSRSVVFTSTIIATKYKGILAPENTTFTMAINPTLIQAISNISAARSYIGYAQNEIFLTNIPQMADILNQPSDSYTFELTSPNGSWSSKGGTIGSSGMVKYTGNTIPVGSAGNNVSGTQYTDIVSTYSFTGTLDECNLQISKLLFLPTPGYTSTANITYNQYKNGTLRATRNFTVSWSANNTRSTAIYLIRGIPNTSTFTWTPTPEERRYYYSDSIVIGGGGGGGPYAPMDTTVGNLNEFYIGTPGTGGYIDEQLNHTLDQSYTITIGDGGLGTRYNNNYPYNLLPPQNGQATTFGTRTALGGLSSSSVSTTGLSIGVYSGAAKTIQTYTSNVDGQVVKVQIGGASAGLGGNAATPTNISTTGILEYDAPDASVTGYNSSVIGQKVAAGGSGVGVKVYDGLRSGQVYNATTGQIESQMINFTLIEWETKPNGNVGNFDYDVRAYGQGGNATNIDYYGNTGYPYESQRIIAESITTNNNNGYRGAIAVKIKPDTLPDDNSSGRTRNLVIPSSTTSVTTANAFLGTSAQMGSKYLRVPYNSSTLLGTGDFTFEGWIRCNQFGLNSTIFTFGNIGMILANMRPGIYLSGGSVQAGTQSIPQFTWRHVAWVREGGTLRVYSSGQLALTQSLPNDYTNQDFYIGANSDLSNPYEGLMDEVRISNIARYTSNFSASVPAGGYADDANTILLLHFNN